MKENKKGNSGVPSSYSSVNCDLNKGAKSRTSPTRTVTILWTKSIRFARARIERPRKTALRSLFPCISESI